MGCNDNVGSTPGLLGECEFDIGCLKTTDGEPTVAPLDDQLPMMYDPDTGYLWYFICDDGWILIGCLNCYEPVVLKGDSGIASLSKCYEISDNFNTGLRLLDNRTGEFHGGAGLPFPLDWSFTNPTNQEGVLRVKTKMWFNRTHLLGGEPSADIQALTLGMIGLKQWIDTYTLDPNELDGQTPHFNEYVSFDIRELPLDNIYPFWGKWYDSLCPACVPDREVAADVEHEFIVAAGATIDISGILAIGYERVIAPGEFEGGWYGMDIDYIFEGHNLIT